MKMTYTRAFSLATALCLLLGLALGCSSASTEQAASQTAQAAAGTSQTEQATEQAVEQPTANDGTFTPPEGFTGGTPPQGFPGNFDGSNMPGGTPPDGFNGNFNGGTPPQGFNGNFDGNMPNGTPPSGGMGEPPSGGMPGGGPGGSSADVTYSGAVEITSADSQSNETYESTTADQSALLIATDQAVTITDATVNKTGNSDGGDSCSFYGLNAAVLAGGTITSDANGANGVFSYGGNGGQNGAAGDGTTVTIRDTTITTTGSGSGGIMTTGGGVTYAYDLNVTTFGQSSAAIRTDRGGGTVYVDGGTYTSNGLGSPAIYSTAEIHVANASLVSNLSEGVCIEGKNSIELVDCDLTANNTGMNGNATFLDSIMIYQSMSGDADSGTSAFTMTGGTLTSQNGHVFHVTVSGAISNAKGDVVSTEVGTVNVTLDESSTWTLTGDTCISSFTGDASGVISNGYTLYVNGVALTGTK